MYEIKGVTTELSATSRVALKVKDNFYTVEMTEKRTIPADADVEQEQIALFDSVNAAVDKQANDILEMFNQKK